MLRNKALMKIKFLVLGLTFVLLFFLILPICTESIHAYEAGSKGDCLLSCIIANGGVESYEGVASKIFNNFQTLEASLLFNIFSLLFLVVFFLFITFYYYSRSYLLEWLRQGRLHPKIY